MKHLLTLAAVLITLPLAAQDRDGGVWRIYQGGVELGREVFSLVGDTLRSETIIPLLGARLEYVTVWNARGHVSRFEATVRPMRGDSVLTHLVTTLEGDSLRYTQVGQAGEEVGAVAGPFDGVAASQGVSAITELVRRARGRDTTLAVWVPGASPPRFAVSVTFGGDSASLAFAGLPMVLRLAPNGRVDVLENPAQRVRIARATGTDLPPLTGLEPPERDYSVPPDAPYRAEEARVQVAPDSGAAFDLAGTLLLPAGDGPFPAVVTITGSGGQDRDENLYPLLPDYRPFREIADRLARAGFAVLRVDDRGVGESGGTRTGATMHDFADDLAAQIAWLRSRPDIVHARIALIGHSEGGVVGPMVAAHDPRIAAVVIMAGTAKPGADVLRDQITRPIETAPGLSPGQRDSLLRAALDDLAADSGATPWLRHFRSYDPLPTAQRLAQPVLILHGLLDRQVSAGQADTLYAAIRASGNDDVTLHIFPTLNHLFLVAPGDGSPVEYAGIADPRLPEHVLAVLETWLVERLQE